MNCRCTERLCQCSSRKNISYRMLCYSPILLTGGKGWHRTSGLSGFNRTLYRLSYLTILESTAGFEPANNRVAACLLRPLGYVLVNGWIDGT